MSADTEARVEVRVRVLAEVAVFAEFATPEELCAYVATPEGRRQIERAVRSGVERDFRDALGAGWLDDDREVFAVSIPIADVEVLGARTDEVV